MSLLSYVSASGAIASSIFIFSLFWNGAVDGTGFHGKGRVFNLSGIPSAVSLYAFCYSAHPILPTLYNSMRNKSHYSGVLFVSFSACTFGYAAAAILGYLMFGQEVESQVTLNLHTGKLMTIPLFGYLMSLVGAMLSVSASILVPSICYLKISGAYKRFGSEMIVNYLIIVMGVAIAVF
ncbi:Vacuolar amino acid transporter 1, partial [Trifolium pratense]